MQRDDAYLLDILLSICLPDWREREKQLPGWILSRRTT